MEAIHLIKKDKILDEDWYKHGFPVSNHVYKDYFFTYGYTFQVVVFLIGLKIIFLKTIFQMKNFCPLGMKWKILCL